MPLGSLTKHIVAPIAQGYSQPGMETTFVPFMAGPAADGASFSSNSAHSSLPLFSDIERIELPNHLPFQAHGSFIPRKTESSIFV